MTSKSQRTSDVTFDGLLMSIRCTFDVKARDIGVAISVDIGVDGRVDGGVGTTAPTSALQSALVSASTSALLLALIRAHQNTSKALMVC